MCRVHAMYQCAEEITNGGTPSSITPGHHHTLALRPLFLFCLKCQVMYIVYCTGPGVSLMSTNGGL